MCVCKCVSVCLSVCLSIYLSVGKSVGQCACLSVCLSPDEENDSKEDDGRPSPRRDLVGNEGAGEEVSNEETTIEVEQTAQVVDSSGNNNAQQKPAGIGKICEGYKNHNCPYGVSGKREVDGRTCPNLHPRTFTSETGTVLVEDVKKAPNIGFIAD